MQLDLLSGGAAQGLVGTLAARFKAQTDAEIAGTYTAIGAVRDKLLAGTPADLVVLSKGMIDELTRSGHVEGPGADIGVVRTAVAARAGDPMPAIATPDELRASLLAADAIYIPDPKLATAGIHVTGILDKLGIRDMVAARLKTFPNGMTAMREMAAQQGRRPIGCTQATEVLHTPGITLAGPLPKAFELATTYTAAIATRAKRPDLARRLLELLTGAESAPERIEAGFETA